MSQAALPIVPPRPHAWIEAFIPKTLVCIREGYGRKFFLNDILAGLTVGVIALPLALAFAIASHCKPEQGLFTAIVAGFLISLLGGSRVQIGGPTGAFVVIIAGIIDRQGYGGLAIATFMAGIILILMGIGRFGGMIKFIPYPVTTGFTTGIALIIFSQQMKDFFGLTIAGNVPGAFISQWATYYHSARDFGVNGYTLGIAAGSVILIAGLRRFAPRVPGYIVAVILATVVCVVFKLDTHHGVATIGTQFGGIPRTLPLPKLPDLHGMTWDKIKSLIPDATTIALLAAIESLLCAVVADGMIGGRHKSNCELVAQGTANIASILFGGIPATGAIARTAANIKSGGRTPLAGMVHAVTVLVVMAIFAPQASKIPLGALSGVLVVVAWNMSERDHFKSLLKAPSSDIIVLLTTFGLTVFVNLSTAVGVGMILAAMLFMKRMSEVTNLGDMKREFEDDTANELTDIGDPNSLDTRDIPRGVEVYEINGPFFFGVADRLKDTLRSLEAPPKVFILRMRRVPAIDATGMHALDEFRAKCRREGTILFLSGVHAQPMFALAKYGLLDKFGEDHLFGNIDDALDRARQIVGAKPVQHPPAAMPEVKREMK